MWSLTTRNSQESKASAASSEAAYTPSRSNPAAPAGDGFMNIRMA